MAHARSVRPKGAGSARLTAALVGLVLLGAAGPARAAAPPTELWLDVDWHVGLLGLAPGEVRTLRWSERLFAPQASADSTWVSSRIASIEFDARGRPAALALLQQRRGEKEQRHDWRYRYDDGDRLVRVDDEAAAGPALVRHYDPAGLLAEEQRRTGVLMQRSTFRRDAAGREIERIDHSGGSGPPTVHTRRYRSDGVIESWRSKGPGGSREVRYDGQGRPLRITESEPFSRATTTISYPGPLESKRMVSGVSLSREGVRVPSRELAFRVRRAEELLHLPEPEQPLWRLERIDGRTREMFTEFDAQGRALVQREVRSEEPTCVNRYRYHPSGLPLSVRATQEGSNTPCPGAPRGYDYEIVVDPRGRWLTHTVWLVDANGRRQRLAEHQREIGDR